MAVRRWHGGISNQEGFTIPGPYVTSPWGEAMFAGTAQLIAHPKPLTGGMDGSRRSQGYGGTIGGMSLLAASVVGITTQAGYYGDMPQSQQGTVAALPPWERE